MKPTQRIHDAGSDWSRRSTPHLVAAVARAGELDVRLIEELLARGPVAEPGVVAVLNLEVSRLDEDEAPLPWPALEEGDPLWLAVVAGEMRSAPAVPALLKLLRVVPVEDYVASLAAAEALAKIGAPAVEGLTELAAHGEWWQRIWSYAALGWNADPGARQALLTALTRERLLTDVVADALADRADAEDGAALLDPLLDPLLDALRTCDPALRIDIEGAIFDLHTGCRDRPIDQDWRLRYQMDPGWGDIHPGWPAVSVMVREENDGSVHRAVHPPRVRTLEEILADPGPRLVEYVVDADGNRLCDCCAVPMWVSTGATVCPATAVAVAGIQHRWLLDLAEDAQLDDLFDVFPVVEEEFHRLISAPRRRGARERERWKARLAELEVGWMGLCWLVEQGIEDVSAGLTRLLAEMTRLAQQHGDPEGVLDASPGTRMN